MSKPTPFAFGSAIWPGLGKLTEEASEVGQVIGKLMGTGGEVNHWDGTDLKQRLEEEIADVLAAAEFVMAFNALDTDAIFERQRIKMVRFTQWHTYGEPALPERG